MTILTATRSSRTSNLISISESTLYPILKRLEEAGCLTVRSEEYNGRLRKYYSITAGGKKRIEDFKSEWKEIMDIYEYVAREEQ